MKNWIIFFLYFFLIPQNKANQNNISGTIIYGFVQNVVSEEQKEKSKELYSFFDKMNEVSKNLTFELKFNNNESLFYLNKVMDSDLNPMGISFVNNIVSRGKYYYNKSEDTILREEHIYGNNTLIETKSTMINNWTLTNESKKIDNYQCYKATRSKTNIGISQEHNFIIEAWYCPELPVEFGPKEFNGLPGLILEVKDTHYTFFAKRINIKNDSLYKIKPLASKNIISLEEHKKRVRETYSKQ